MKNPNPKTFLIASLLALSLSPLRGKDTTATLSPSVEHYQYLKEENQKFREFVENERKEHRQFLEDAYNRTTILISVFSGILAATGIFLGFLGFNRLKDVKDKALLEYEKQIKVILQAALANTDQKIQALQRLVNQEEMWISSRLRFIVPEKVIPTFKKEELAYFGGEKPQFHVAPFQEQEDWGSFHAIIHYFDPDDKGEDETLKKLLAQLKGQSIPLIVYTHGLWIEKNETKKVLDAYQFNSPANNIITLLNNTGDAFRLKLNTR